MKNDTAIRRTEALSLRPYPRLSIVIRTKQLASKDWDHEKVVVFESTFDPVLGHAIGKSGDTEAM
jgi:hypothetical protein